MALTIAEAHTPRNSSIVNELVIDALAQENRLLRDQNASVEADRDTYREIAIAALDALARVTQQHQRLRDDYRQQNDAYRWLTEDLMLRAGADDHETL
jgi:hypothetical protein